MMTKDTLETAKFLEERMRNVQNEVDSIEVLKDLTEVVSIANPYHNIAIQLTATEKELILPALLERKEEELRLLQEEFERL